MQLPLIVTNQSAIMVFHPKYSIGNLTLTFSVCFSTGGFCSRYGGTFHSWVEDGKLYLSNCWISQYIYVMFHRNRNIVVHMPNALLVTLTTILITWAFVLKVLPYFIHVMRSSKRN